MNVAVVLPAHNEQENLAPLVTALVDVARRDAVTLRVIVVDDGSTDGTAAELASLIASTPNLSVLSHQVNRGFAEALKTGLGAACQSGCDAVVLMDADLSHHPEEMPMLVSALEAGADLALGSRFVAGGRMEGVPVRRQVISRIGNEIARRLLGLPARDLTTGYRAIRRRVLDAIVLHEDGFTIQLETVVKAYAAGFVVVEVPIVLGTRGHGRSHMSYSRQLFASYWRLLRTCRRFLRASRQ